jgi:hypothetical protein
MSRISDLDKILLSVKSNSANLTPISDVDLSLHVDIEIDILVEYLMELADRRFITYDTNGSYITFTGRSALENSRNGKPFQEDYVNKKLKRTWSVMKIIAASLNAIAIIAIAIWAQIKSDKKSDIDKEYRLLKERYEKEQVIYSNQIDSLEKIKEESINSED